MSHLEHKELAPRSVRCYVVTVSDTRTVDTDTAGRAIADLLGAAGHEIVGRTIVRDDPSWCAAPSNAARESPGAGDHHDRGTGIASRDSTHRPSGLLTSA